MFGKDDFDVRGASVKFSTEKLGNMYEVVYK